MVKTVSATEAKNSLGALLKGIRETSEPVVIESRGKPYATLISSEQWQRFQDLDRAARSAEALRLLRELQRENSSRNADLTDDEIDELAIDVVMEVRRERREAQRVVAETEPEWDASQ